jgi:hypothetical protein
MKRVRGTSRQKVQTGQYDQSSRDAYGLGATKHNRVEPFYGLLSQLHFRIASSEGTENDLSFRPR